MLPVGGFEPKKSSAPFEMSLSLPLIPAVCLRRRFLANGDALLLERYTYDGCTLLDLRFEVLVRVGPFVSCEMYKIRCLLQIYPRSV
jgi:hypothetical protein